MMDYRKWDGIGEDSDSDIDEIPGQAVSRAAASAAAPPPPAPPPPSPQSTNATVATLVTKKSWKQKRDEQQQERYIGEGKPFKNLAEYQVADVKYQESMAQALEYAKEVNNGRSCQNCLKHESDEKMMKCGGCGYTYYCSRACQRAAWNKHKVVCRGATKENKDAYAKMLALTGRDANDDYQRWKKTRTDALFLLTVCILRGDRVYSNVVVFTMVYNAKLAEVRMRYRFATSFSRKLFVLFGH
jgi:hypothetical protein